MDVVFAVLEHGEQLLKGAKETNGKSVKFDVQPSFGIAGEGCKLG